MSAADAALAFGTALGVVFVAELGDKTQFLLAAQAARGPPRRIALEASAAFAVLTAAAVLAGAWVARVVPPAAATLASGALFVAFGLLALRRKGEDEDGEAGRKGGRGTFLLVLLAELGDKTQLATAALAASSASPLATGLGAWLALSASAVLAVVAGAWLTSRLEPRRRALLSAAVFLAVGAATLAYGLWLLLR